MANRYVLKFSKNGYARFTSHLDILRFFKRAFRQCGISLKYSQGFNPHPKMSFAQPLSLGYSSVCELLEFETEKFHELGEMEAVMKGHTPEGINVEWIKAFNEAIGYGADAADSTVKSLAAAAESAEYSVRIPMALDQVLLDDLLQRYKGQEEIIALKRQKKTKKQAPVNIKNMIRSLEGKVCGSDAVLLMELDCGSVSNCSPELVISSFIQFAGADIPRYKIDVERRKIKFVNNLQI